MRLTILVVALACLLGGVLALALSPQRGPGDGAEFVREERSGPIE